MTIEDYLKHIKDLYRIMKAIENHPHITEEGKAKHLKLLTDMSISALTKLNNSLTIQQ